MSLLYDNNKNAVTVRLFVGNKQDTSICYRQLYHPLSFKYALNRVVETPLHVRHSIGVTVVIYRVTYEQWRSSKKLRTGFKQRSVRRSEK